MMGYTVIKTKELDGLRARNDYLDREIQASHKEYRVLAEKMHPYIDKLIRVHDNFTGNDFLSITTEFSSQLLVSSIGEWREIVAREVVGRVRHFLLNGVIAK